MFEKKVDVGAFQDLAAKMRREIVAAVNRAGCGHPGGSLSAVEIFIALYGYKMRHKPKQPDWPDRDRLVISKGHCSPAAYVALSSYGYFPKEELKRYRTYGSILQGHVHTKVPGIEFSTGSLGHGLSVANGMALGARILKKDFRVYCFLGDGEIQEGSVWEAAMTASHHKLDHVCAIVDYNKVQENGPTNEIKNLEPIVSKWDSFGWKVIEIDGHDFHELMNALDQAETTNGRPTVIIANTVKGKGVSFMEGSYKWHGRAPKGEDFDKAMEELK